MSAAEAVMALAVPSGTTTGSVARFEPGCRLVVYGSNTVHEARIDEGFAGCEALSGLPAEQQGHLERCLESHLAGRWPALNDSEIAGNERCIRSGAGLVRSIHSDAMIDGDRNTIVVTELGRRRTVIYHAYGPYPIGKETYAQGSDGLLQRRGVSVARLLRHHQYGYHGDVADHIVAANRTAFERQKGCIVSAFPIVDDDPTRVVIATAGSCKVTRIRVATPSDPLTLSVGSWGAW